MRRGEVWYASLPEPVGAGPGYRRPVVVVQSNEFNNSNIATVVVAAMTGNVRLAEAAGNVLCRRRDTGLPRDSVVNVSAILTIDRALLEGRVGTLPPRLLQRVDAGLRIVLNV